MNKILEKKNRVQLENIFKTLKWINSEIQKFQNMMTSEHT